MTSTSLRKNKTRILCFGDSNTWGYDPGDQSRYPESVRWTGRLQEKLGGDFQIIEEGLNGRTTIFEYRERPGKVGLTYLRPCLDSHHKLDFVILCLGTNDCKREFGKTAREIADGFEQLVEMVLGKGLERPSPGVKLIVASPLLLDERYIGDYAEMVGAEAKTREFAPLYQEIAAKHGAAFVDLSVVAPSQKDGCHIDPDGHARIAEIFYAALLPFIMR